MMKTTLRTLSVLCIAIFGLTSAAQSQAQAQAQDPAASTQNDPFFDATAPVQAALPESVPQNEIASTSQNPSQDEIDADGGFNTDEYASLLFTFWEQTAIEDSRNSRGLVRAPSESELMRDLNKKDEGPKAMPPPEERDIRLGGIVYRKKGDWTIWLNGKRVTPEALPEEILDLRVFKDYVEIKWFDEYTDQIFPIRLRPHQRFNIDTRIFLPG